MKDVEMYKRGAHYIDTIVADPEQLRPGNFQEVLQNEKFLYLERI